MSVFSHLLPHFRAQRRLFSFGVAALLLTNLAQQGIPLLLKAAIDDLSAGKAIAMVALWASLRLGMVLLQGVLRYGWRMGFFGMARHVEYGMRRQLFAKLLSLPAAYYLKNRVGDLLSRAMSDLATVRESLGRGWLSFLDAVSMVGLTLAFMLRMDPGLTLWILLPMILLPLLIMTMGRKVRESARQAQEALDGLSQAATESFRGARVIQAYAREQEEAGRFIDISRSYMATNMRLIKLEAYYWPLLAVITGLSELLLFYLGGNRVLAKTLSLGGFVAMHEYLLQAIWPIMALGFSTNIYVRGKVSVERLNEVYDSQADITDGPGVAPDDRAPALEFEALSFSYPDGSPALDALSLKLRAGDWVGLAGRTGAGKSSLLKLACRVHDPLSGQVKLAGSDLKLWKLAEMRANCGVVMQEPFLFSETILENIAFGAAEPDLKLARDSAQAADLHAFISTLPEGYQAMLGEKGVNLSGGQKQRLALARALYQRPKLLLLDDAFSAVDTATEERIVKALRQELPEATVLLVSHRISTLNLCDRILVMEQGRIVEDGKHADLMLNEGFYFEMARREQLARKAGLALG